MVNNKIKECPICRKPTDVGLILKNGKMICLDCQEDEKNKNKIKKLLKMDNDDGK